LRKELINVFQIRKIKISSGSFFVLLPPIKLNYRLQVFLPKISGYQLVQSLENLLSQNTTPHTQGINRNLKLKVNWGWCAFGFWWSVAHYLAHKAVAQCELLSAQFDN
jgi:hypothetical protein